jgi:uncharacterized phiE125 gp8 family phage protein
VKTIVKTAPASEPLTLAEAKAHLRLTHNLEDAYVNALIQLAREKFEKDTGRAVIETTFELYLDSLAWNKEFNADILLYKCPVIYVTSVHVLATDDATEYTPIDNTEYKTDVIGEPGRIRFPNGITYGDTENAIKVTYKAGYSSVPAQVKEAMLILIGHFYENRQSVVTGTQVNSVPMTYEFLVDQFKFTI